MAIIFNSFYRMTVGGELQVAPAPVDKNTPDAPWYTDKIAAMARELASIGFTDILWPVLTKAQGGSAPNADGYGKYDDYDLGSKDQCYSRPTRWGSVDQLRRAIAATRAAGLRNLSDIVIHQYDGGAAGAYHYLGADGKSLTGRFPKHPSCFVGPAPGVPADPVFDAEGNMAFGDMVSYVNSTPQNYMRDGIIAAIQWQIESLDLDGFRLDDTKGENAAVTRYLLNAPVIRDLYVFGECFTGNPAELERWVDEVGAATLDFQLHFALQAVANNGASCVTLDGAGFTTWNPARSVTFADTGDTDGKNGESIISNKLLVYAYLLTVEGTPMVYARDYLQEPNCYGLKPWIDNLVWINRTFAFGHTTTRFVDNTLIVLNRDGDGGSFGWSGGLLTAINFGPMTRTVTCATGFGPNRHLHDYTGHASHDVWTDGEGNVTLTVPGNYFGGGQSFCCFAPAGVDAPIPITPRPATQAFFGAADLDLPPAINGPQTLSQSIFCARDTAVSVKLTADHTGWTSTSRLVARVTGPDLRELAECRQSRSASFTFGGKVSQAGWHTITLTGENLPAAGSPFKLSVTYTGGV